MCSWWVPAGCCEGRSSEETEIGAAGHMDLEALIIILIDWSAALELSLSALERPSATPPFTQKRGLTPGYVDVPGEKQAFYPRNLGLCRPLDIRGPSIPPRGHCHLETHFVSTEQAASLPGRKMLSLTY